MINFFNIFLKPKDGIMLDDIQPTMNLALDWYRYFEYCWIVKSTSNAKQWRTRLQKFVEPGGRLLITTFNENDYQGWMNKDFWEWLKKAKA